MIYYVEDDEQIRNLTLYTLTQAGYAAEGMQNAAELYSALDRQIPELILLDVMLPGEDGVSICTRLRRRKDTAAVPIMMLTAKDTEFDTVCGLDAGADDYLAKPFGMMELLSRVNALLRRARIATQPPSEFESEVLEVGSIELDEAAHVIRAGGRDVSLTRKEFDLLAFLMRNKGLVVTRDRLLDAVWGYDIAGETRTVDAHVQTLRKKLSAADASAAALVETVRGVGYRLKTED